MLDYFNSFFGPSVPTISAKDVYSKLQQEQKPFILDVREPYEYAQGHIAGAVLIPLGELDTRLGELPKDAEVVCICAHGNRSVDATRFLTSAGYKAVNMKNGMAAWQMARLPVER